MIAYIRSLDPRRLIKCSVLGVALTLTLASLAGRAQEPRQERHRQEGQDKKNQAAISLGARLFQDERFSTPKGDLPASCSHCHMFDESGQGIRAHADFLNRSWVSYRAQDPRREESRNSPTLFDVGKMARLHFDGEFGSLEELVKGTLSGRPMGWLPGEQQDAFNQIQRVILADKAPDGSYRDQFKQAYGVNVESAGRDALMDWVAKAIADFTRTLNAKRTTPYDKFIEGNGLAAEPQSGEDVNSYSKRLLDGIAALETSGKLKLPAGFDQPALAGLKLFFSYEGPSHVGNCAVCHSPPLFTDFSFHNTGVSQSEYDAVHGEGGFAALEIPKASKAARPAPQFRDAPSKRRLGVADLGHWNFANLENSPLRRVNETNDQFLDRMIGTFKTPTLRNLAFTNPYMHNGAFASLEDALAELARLAQLSRGGLIRQGDPELANIRISEEDIAPLAAFLNTLNQDLKQK